MKLKMQKGGQNLMIAVRELKKKETFSGRRIDSIYLWIGYEMYEEMTNQG